MRWRWVGRISYSYGKSLIQTTLVRTMQLNIIRDLIAAIRLFPLPIVSSFAISFVFVSRHSFLMAFDLVTIFEGSPRP